jgi:hypothetical protein
MESHEFHREVERPSLRAGKVQKEVHIVLVFVKRAERREIHAAGITVRDQVFTGSPGEFGLAVFYGDLKLYVPTVTSALETLPEQPARNAIVSISESASCTPESSRSPQSSRRRCRPRRRTCRRRSGARSPSCP